MPAPTARTMVVRVLQRSHALVLVLGGALLCGACGGKEPPLPQKPPPTRGIPRARTTNTSTTLPAQTPEANGVGQSAPFAARARAGEPPPKAAEQEAPPEAKKERDYSAELSALLSKSVPGCLAASPPGTSSASIAVTVYVVASGTVSRAEVQGAGVPAPALACIKKAAGGLQLKAPVADAPRSVQTQLTLQTQGMPKAAQPTAAAEDSRDDERDGNPRDSKIHHVDDHPPEVEQKLYEPTREGPEPPDPKDEPPGDNHTD